MQGYMRYWDGDRWALGFFTTQGTKWGYYLRVIIRDDRKVVVKRRYQLAKRHELAARVSGIALPRSMTTLWERMDWTKGARNEYARYEKEVLA